MVNIKIKEEIMKGLTNNEKFQEKFPVAQYIKEGVAALSNTYQQFMGKENTDKKD